MGVRYTITMLLTMVGCWLLTVVGIPLYASFGPDHGRAAIEPAVFLVPIYVMILTIAIGLYRLIRQKKMDAVSMGLLIYGGMTLLLGGGSCIMYEISSAN